MVSTVLGIVPLKGDTCIVHITIPLRIILKSVDTIIVVAKVLGQNLTWFLFVFFLFVGFFFWEGGEPQSVYN